MAPAIRATHVEMQSNTRPTSDERQHIYREIQNRRRDEPARDREPSGNQMNKRDLTAIVQRHHFSDIELFEFIMCYLHYIRVTVAILRLWHCLLHRTPTA